MLVKSTPGVNFTNVLGAAFAHEDPQSAKNTVKFSLIFVLLGSVCVKVNCKTLVKFTPDFVVEASDNFPQPVTVTKRFSKLFCANV